MVVKQHFDDYILDENVKRNLPISASKNISLACFLYHSVVVLCMHSEVLLCYSIKQRKGLGARGGGGDSETEPGKCSAVQFEGKQYEGKNAASGTLHFLKSELHTDVYLIFFFQEWMKLLYDHFLHSTDITEKKYGIFV